MVLKDTELLLSSLLRLCCFFEMNCTILYPCFLKDYLEKEISSLAVSPATVNGYRELDNFITLCAVTLGPLVWILAPIWMCSHTFHAIRNSCIKRPSSAKLQSSSFERLLHSQYGKKRVDNGVQPHGHLVGDKKVASIHQVGTNTGKYQGGHAELLATTPLIIPLGTVNVQAEQAGEIPVVGAHLKHDENKENGFPRDSIPTICQNQSGSEQQHLDDSPENPQCDKRQQLLVEPSSIELQMKGHTPENSAPLAGEGNEKSLGHTSASLTTDQEMSQDIVALLNKVCTGQGTKLFSATCRLNYLLLF